MPAAAATTTAKKRKAPTNKETEAANKRAKVVEDGAASVKAILEDASSSEELLALAQYARLLEEEVASLRPQPKSASDVAKEVGKLRASVRSGIVKQMGVRPLGLHTLHRDTNSSRHTRFFLQWKPSCKTGGSKWAYDGVCNDAEVFGRAIGLDEAPTFKMKKFSKDEMENALGDLTASIR